ncbi:MAG: hypothetical protein GY759_00290 [Chloroflexi bacterium]|nr:hypothetical protein [Chloroflexota bacterium]
MGETNIDGEAAFIRVSPRFFAGLEVFFHRPKELIFDQEWENLSIDDSAVAFEVVNGEKTVEFASMFDGEYYKGII